MVVRRDFGSYRQADANGDSRAARVQYRLGRAAAVLAHAGLCGVHGDLGRDRGVFVRRDSGVLGAAEAPRTLSASLTPLPEGSCRRRRLRGGRHGKQQKPRSRPKPQTPLTKQACTSSP